MTAKNALNAFAVREHVLRDGQLPLVTTRDRAGHALAYYDALALLYALEREGWQVGKARDGVWWCWLEATGQWRRVAVIRVEQRVEPMEALK